MFKEGGYNPEEARQRAAEAVLKKEYSTASAKSAAEFRENQAARLEKETKKQLAQYADEALEKIMEIPALSERFLQDKSFQMEVGDLKKSLENASGLDQAQKIIDSFSSEVGAAMRDFLPAVTGTEVIPPEDPRYFEQGETRA